MNFLAHAYLSFGDPDILVGNMISDFVKGRAWQAFPPRIQQGILLHRAIDAFTDAHPASRQGREVFRPHYRLYSSPILDIIYDHFLAADTSVFSEDALRAFTAQVYAQLEAQAGILPPNFALMLPYMKKDNWLFHYRTEAGIGRSLRGLARRATYISEGDTALRLLNEQYAALQACYQWFLPDVKEFAKQQFGILKA